MSVLGILWLTQLVAVLSADPTGSVVAKVNGTAITTNDVDFAALQQGLSDEQKETDKSKLLDQLIDRQLIRAFLASKKVSPVADELQTVEAFLKANGNRKEAYEDVIWALLNTKEFLFNH